MANPKAPFIGKTGSLELDAEIFTEPFNSTLVHECVVAEQNARRRGTASTLKRGEVAMTTAKAWRQKGTGRARVGALSTGHRRGGGVTFGPKPRHYISKVNRKARRKALRSALSLHADRGTIAAVDPTSFEKPSTKRAAADLLKWRDGGSVLIIVATAGEENCLLSFRNIKRVRGVLPASNVGISDIIGAQNLVVSEAAIKELKLAASTEITRGPAVAVAAGAES